MSAIRDECFCGGHRDMALAFRMKMANLPIVYSLSFEHAEEPDDSYGHICPGCDIWHALSDGKQYVTTFPSYSPLFPNYSNL